MLTSQPQKWSESEKRALALLPDFPEHISGINSLFRSTDTYLEDHFGLRSFFLSRYKREIEKRFDKTSIHPRVIKGLEGWLYFNDFDLQKDFLGLIPLTDDQLDQFLIDQQEKHEWLKGHDIRFIYAIAPNKQSIYPRYVMENAIKMKGVTRFEQLTTRLDGHLPEYMLDLHTLLTPDEFTIPLYYKNDSHWNKLAAFTVFQNIMDKIALWFPDEEFRLNFEFIEPELGIGGNTGLGGDLAIILRKPHLTERYPQIKHFKRCGGNTLPLTYNLSNIQNQKGRSSFLRRCTSRDLKAIIFRDSFFTPLEPFFSENFAEVLYLWKGYDRKNIEEILKIYKPDIIIEMVVERHAFDSLLSSTED